MVYYTLFNAYPRWATSSRTTFAINNLPVFSSLFSPAFYELRRAISFVNDSDRQAISSRRDSMRSERKERANKDDLVSASCSRGLQRR
jgi:hypothetical protein